MVPSRTITAIPDIDVVICTKDRPDDLARLLPTVVAQVGPTFRCIVVDQSVDRTTNERLVERLADDRIVYLVDERVGKSRALNLGLSRSTAPVIAFTDDDCELPSNWLAQATGLVGGDVGLAFGNVVAVEHDETEFFVPALQFERAAVISASTIRVPTLLGMGASMVIDRSVLDDAGGFDEKLGPGGELATGEDCEFAYRILRSGSGIAQRPEWTLLHHGKRSIDDDAARRLVVSSFFGIGVGYGMHLRSGDWRAGVICVLQSAQNIGEIAGNVLRRRRPLHIRRLAAFWQGVVTGLRVGLDAPSIRTQH